MPDEQSDLEPFVTLRGYAAEQTSGGRWRLYLRPEQTAYVEVRGDDVIDSSAGDEPGTATLRVRPRAALSYTRELPGAAQARFLSGGIASAFLSPAATRAPILGGTVGIDYPRTEDKICELATFCSSCVSGMRPCPTGVRCGPL